MAVPLTPVLRRAVLKMEPTKQRVSTWSLLRQIHKDEKGGVSIETVLIIAAIALPILIFIIKFGWPRIKEFFERGMDDLEGGAGDAANDT